MCDKWSCLLSLSSVCNLTLKRSRRRKEGGTLWLVCHSAIRDNRTHIRMKWSVLTSGHLSGIWTAASDPTNVGAMINKKLRVPGGRFKKEQKKLLVKTGLSQAPNKTNTFYETNSKGDIKVCDHNLDGIRASEPQTVNIELNVFEDGAGWVWWRETVQREEGSTRLKDTTGIFFFYIY